MYVQHCQTKNGLSCFFKACILKIWQLTLKQCGGWKNHFHTVERVYSSVSFHLALHIHSSEIPATLDSIVL